MDEKQIENVRRIYDVPGKRWERERLINRSTAARPASCTFEQMLQSAIAQRAAIDAVDAIRRATDMVATQPLLPGVLS